MANERIGLTAVLELGSFSQGVSSYLKSVDQMSRQTASTAGSISSQFSSLGGSVLKFGAIAGGVALAGVGALVGGLVLLGSTALGEFAKYERMSLSIESLVARQLSQGTQVETQRTVAIGLTKKETEELGGLAEKIKEEELSRNTLKARIQEQSEALRQLRDAHGADALDVQTATARLAEMEHQYQTSGSEIQQLIGRQAELSDGTQNYATVIEKVRTGQMSMTEAMTQAGPKAKELLGWISKLAIQSPFTEEGVNLAFQTALAYGFNIDTAKRLTQAEVDYAAATGKGVETTNLIALALGQMEAKGKVSGQEIIQLTNAGIGVNKILEDMGFTLDDVSNGLVDSDKFIEAVITDMEIFKGAGAAQSETFSGLISTLSDLKAIGLREFFAGTFTTIQPYLADFVGMLTSAALETGSIKRLGEVLGVYVAEGLKVASGFAIALYGSISKVVGAFSRFGVRGGAISILGQLGFTPESIASVTSTIDTIVSEIGRIQAVFANFGLSGVAFSIGGLLGLDSDSMIAIQTTVTGIIATITSFATQVQTLFAGMGIEEFKGALFGIGAVLATGVFAALVAGVLSLLTPFTLLTGAVILFSTAWAGNWGGIQEIAATTFATITELFNQFMLTWNTNWPIIQAVALTAWEIIQGVMAGFQTALGPVIAQLTIQFTQIGASLAGMGINWTTTWDAIVTATGIVAAGIGAAILLIIGVVAGLATGIAGGISASIVLFQSLATTATEVFTSLTTIFTGWITTISALLSGDFAGAWEGFKTVLQGTVTLVTSIFTGMLSAVTGVLGVLTATIGGFAEGIVGFFQGMYDSLIGNSIIPDLVNGIVKWFKDLPQKIVSGLGDLTTKVVAPFEKLGTTIKGELGEAITWLTDDALPLLNKGLDFVVQAIKDVIGYFNSLKDAVSSFTLPDVLMGHSPPPMANFLMDIAGGAQRATQAIADMGRNMLTSGASARDFFGSLDAGGIAAGNQVSNWNDLRDILQLNTSTAMNILASGGGSAGIMDLVRQESANWGISPALASSIVESQGLMDHLMSTFNEFQTQMRLKNLGNMLQLGGTASGLGGTFAGMLEAQMGNADEANKTVATYQKLSTEIDTSKNKLATLQQELEVLTTSEGAHQIALDKKNLAIEKTTEAIEFNRRQLEIYEQELAGMQEGTLAWDKKKLSIDKTTEAIDSQGKQLITLKEELEKLDVANNADTLSIEKKRLEIEKLTAEMAKNQQAVIAAREDFEALATGSAADQIAFLQSFLESGADSIRLIGEELGGIFAGQGLTSDVYWTRVEAQERLAELLEEQRRQEELITQQKEAQGKLDKLKAQLDLINLGRQLGGDIFAGINFGLDASIEDLLAATNAVTMAMVDQINHDLQIHSPSGVMIKTFEQVMAGAALGVRRGESMLSDAVRSIPILNGSMPQFSQAAGISNSSTYNYNFPMTVNTAATAQGVVRQYDVRRSLANV